MIFGFGRNSETTEKKSKPRTREETYFTYRYNPEDHDGATADAVRALIDSVVFSPYNIRGMGHPIPLDVIQKVLKVWVNVDFELITHSEMERRKREERGDTDADQSAAEAEE